MQPYEPPTIRAASPSALRALGASLATYRRGWEWLPWWGARRFRARLMRVLRAGERGLNLAKAEALARDLGIRGVDADEFHGAVILRYRGHLEQSAAALLQRLMPAGVGLVFVRVVPWWRRRPVWWPRLLCGYYNLRRRVLRRQ